MAKKKPAKKSSKPSGVFSDDGGESMPGLEDILQRAGLSDVAKTIAEKIAGQPKGRRRVAASGLAKNALMAAGGFIAGFAVSKLMKGSGDLSHLNQADKKVKVLSMDTLLDGGTQEWFLEADGMRVRFDVDGGLESKTKDRIYVYNSATSPKRLLDLGGMGEFQIAIILRRWLDQFWSPDQQKEMMEVEKIEFGQPDEVVGSYPQTAKAALELAKKLEARQKQ